MASGISIKPKDYVRLLYHDNLSVPAAGNVSVTLPDAEYGNTYPAWLIVYSGDNAQAQTYVGIYNPGHQYPWLIQLAKGSNISCSCSNTTITFYNSSQQWGIAGSLTVIGL